jgi:hypothetical protein
MRIAWIGQSARARSTNASDITLKNAYAEVVEHKQGKSIVTVYRTPGLKLWLTLPGTGAVRGMFYAASQDRTFAVQGATLWEMAPNGTLTSRGTLLTTAGALDFDENGVDLAIVDGNNRYHLTFATNFFERNTTYPSASRVGFIDNYLIYLKPFTQEFGWSDLLSTSVPDLNTARAEGRPDPLVSMLVVRREIWLFGWETTQPFYSTGDPDTPFAPIPSIFLHQGCVAPQSPARVGETLCWVGRNEQGQATVVQAAGQQVQRISTHALETALHGYADLKDALGWGQQDQGHSYYWLTFPTGNATWVYDATTQLWHERGYRDPATGMLGRHRANCYVFAFGRHYVGDYQSGAIYELDDQTYTDNGEALVLEAILPVLFDGENAALIEQKWFLLECETGVGLDGGLEPGRDPQVLLFLSQDGGHLYEPAPPRSLGPIGRTKHIVEWRALGSSWDRRCKIVISDPVRVAITGAITEVAPLLR